MNRQVRRIEEKKERKAEREKEKAKQEKQQRRQQRREARRKAAERRARGESAPEAAAPAGPRTSNPGRFSGALMAATVFFIALQTVAPTDGSIVSQVVSASFYLLFGYFATLWMMRRKAPQPLFVAIVAGVMMTLATLASQAFQPALEIAPVMLILAVPFVVGGAFLGRLVWNRAP